MSKTPDEIIREIIESQQPLSRLEEIKYRAHMDCVAKVLEQVCGEYEIAELVRNRLKEHIAHKEACGRKSETRAQLIKQIDALQQDIIRLNEEACRKDFEQGLTPDEFVQLPEVIAKEKAMKKLDSLCEILRKFYPPEIPPEEIEEEEVPLY